MTIQDFTSRLLAHMGVDGATVDVEEGDVTAVKITVPDEDSGLLIGYHGECITAIQRVLYLAFSREDKEKRFIVNVNDYTRTRWRPEAAFADFAPPAPRPNTAVSRSTS